jgi:polyisoprenyl-teichoic acid--peptidoglycan teichoic acid transferase
LSKRIIVDGPEPSPGRCSAADEGTPAPRWSDRIAYILGISLIVLGLVSGFVAYTMVRSQTLNPIVGVVNYFVPAPESVFGKERIYVMLLGLDYDYDNLDNPTSKDARTDKIEIFALDFPTKVVESVAVPRDMDALVQGHEDKINDAFHYGGWRNTDKVVGQFLGMPLTDRETYFDRYIVLRINASKDIINAIGGIDVPVTETINYDDNWGHLHIHFKPGLYHMNGDEAVSYARFRHDACSDPCRIKRQQQVEHLVIEKLKRDKFNDLTHIAQLIDVLKRNVDTNLTGDEMKSLGWAFRDVNLADVHSTQIPFIADKELNCCGDVLVPDDAGRTKIVTSLLGPYLAATPPPTTQGLAAVNPATIKVDVRNGSGIPGLGAKMALQLKKAGYVVSSVGNADSFDYPTTLIQAHSKTPLAGERVRSDIKLDGATVKPLPAPSAAGATDITLVVGRDYETAPAALSPAPSPAK